MVDDWGTQVDIRYTRMRYEVAIAREPGERRPDRLRVVHEALLPVQRSSDPWARRYIRGGRDIWLPALRTGRTVPFISTSSMNGLATVYLHQDGHGGDMATAAQGGERTVLSTISNTEFPHAFAAREEMRGWRRMELEPQAVAGGGESLSHSFIGADGGNLAAALLRMKGEDPEVLQRIAADLACVAPGVTAVEVDERGPWGEPSVTIITRKHGRHSLRLLGSGALRLLAFSALKNDPDAGGVLALEEPEHGFDVFALGTAAPLLLSMSTDLDGEERGRLRQVIAVTRSIDIIRRFAAELVARNDGLAARLPELLFAYRAAGDAPESASVVTCFASVTPSAQLALGFDQEGEELVHTLAEVEQALESPPVPDLV